MLTINKTWAALPIGDIQSNQKQTSPKLQTLYCDTVSFSGFFNTTPRKYVSDAVMETVKKAEQETGRNFFKGLRKLCEDAEDGDLAGKVEADAQMLKGELKEKALSLLDLIEKDSVTYPLLKETAKYLKECAGKPYNIK
ncbi:MAG: hypothetical protein PHC34_01865 [Candidatus Gastranaerophilales bacterium]|nr:hypothetical protein [Candidatus Gastranaerophilales bacterium]